MSDNRVENVQIAVLFAHVRDGRFDQAVRACNHPLLREMDRTELRTRLFRTGLDCPTLSKLFEAADAIIAQPVS